MPISGSYFYPVMQRPPASRASPAVFDASGTFSGDFYSVIMTGTYIGAWSNVAVSLLNNSSISLKSGSVEVSPDNTNWIVLHTASFSPLAPSAIAQYQISGNSQQLLRVRGWPSGSGGATSGSVRVILSVNNS